MRIITISKRVLFILLLGFFVFFSCEVKAQNNSNKKEKKSLSDEKDTITKESSGKLEDFNIEEYSEDGSKKWEVKAATAKVYKNIVRLTDIKGVSYGKDTTVDIKAKNGKYYKNSQNLQLRDHVVATTSDGIQMFTDKLNWLASEERAYTDTRVLVKNDRIKISGEGAKAKPDLEKIEFEQNVVTNVEPDTVIVCKGPLKVNYKLNTAVFNKDVVVKDNRGKIWADKITVYFNNNRKIEKVIAEGNVKVKRGKNITRSQKAEYIKGENKVTFTGAPKLVIYPEEEKNKDKNSKSSQ